VADAKGGANVQATSGDSTTEHEETQPVSAEPGTGGDSAVNFTFLGVPFAGELPIDLTTVADCVQSLLAGIDVDLPAEGWSYETYAVLTVTALLAGGIAYRAHARPRHRRSLGGAPGLDSVLAYWDDRNDTPPR
jgi:hypothetical protein